MLKSLVKVLTLNTQIFLGIKNLKNINYLKNLISHIANITDLHQLAKLILYVHFQRALKQTHLNPHKTSLKLTINTKNIHLVNICYRE